MPKHSLALQYHENTKAVPELQPYDTKMQYKIYPNAEAIPLEKNNTTMIGQDNKSFLHVLMSRKSIRAFTSDNINLETLSKLLTLSCGLNNDTENSIKRTYASAGGRYPIEVYVAIFRSDDMEKGLYHFNVINNTLELIKRGDYSKEIYDFYENQKSAITTDYPCLIMFSMVFKRSMEKYGERGYRFALLDAGHMSQNLYLVATYLNLGIVAIGAGMESDDKLDDMLGLVHNEENVFYSFATGIPYSKDI